MLPGALTEVANAYSEDATNDILKILCHYNFSLEMFNFFIAALTDCQAVNACIADTCRRPPEQSKNGAIIEYIA